MSGREHRDRDLTQGTESKENTQKSDGRLARGEATRERVLDAAERCFAARGFEAVTIRQIAREAGVTLGVVGFHGGSKEDLFTTVVTRRAETLHNLRMAGLSALRQQGNLTIRALVDAYITPYLEIASRGDPQWRAYAKLIAREASHAPNSPHVRNLYNPAARAFITEILALCPDARPEVPATTLTLMVSSMLSIVASRERVAELTGLPISDSPVDYRDVLVDFCTGGIEKALGRA